MQEPNNELPQEEEQREKPEETGESPKKGSIPLLLTILSVLVIPAAVGAAVAYSQYPRIAEKAAATGMALSGGQDAKEEPLQYGHFITISELLINPAGTGGKGFLVVTLGLETKSSSVISEVEEKEIVIRDAILQLLSEHTQEDLAAIELRGVLKEEIIGELNRILQKGDIDRLYFTQFLLQ